MKKIGNMAQQHKAVIIFYDSFVGITLCLCVSRDPVMVTDAERNQLQYSHDSSRPKLTEP